ncbi:uncharacterized protein LOC108831073 [Raphanus sativus]|uniref:Uncharacterized protein LOC108831073 n=1 Tax=Raphanus sativus TaxID=3726 RepID=A0A6J0LKC2_RAPSA|nr:uncharacterized protein LOC108831073 [Raphanus sativus]
MEDIGGKGRPPGDPPDNSGSWLQKVVGSNAGGMPVPEEAVGEEFVESRLRLEFPNGEDGEPVITIEDEVLMAMNNLWKRCMIVRVLGRNVPISNLNRKLKELWKPKGSMFVMDLPRQFFMVRFELEEEYMAALSGGPWRAFGSYLMVQAWTPEFDPLKDDIVTTPVWVRLSHIPVNFYHKTILMGIAKGLGRPIKVDGTTLKFERARFARICVEVNLNKPLKGSVMINGERYYVSYEGISAICSTCGMYGHLVHACPRNATEKAPSQVNNQAIVNHVNTEAKEMDEGFIQGKQARRKPEQMRQAGGSMQSNEGKNMVGSKLREARNGNAGKEIKVSNRFGSLVEEREKEELIEDTGRIDENKENEDTVNLSSKDLSRVRGKAIAFGHNEKNMQFTATEKKGSEQVVRLGPKEKKGSTLRGPYFQKSKLKPVGPTRGLIYGPARGELDLSMSGKRLRVEKESLGRPGGAFAGDGESGEREKNSGQAGERRNIQEILAPSAIPTLDESEDGGGQLGEGAKSMEA